MPHTISGIPASLLDETVLHYEHQDAIARQEELRRVAVSAPPSQALTPVSTSDRSANLLRPTTFDDIVGQAKVKKLISRMVGAAKARQKPLDHVLMVGPSGTGKTTMANAIAHEMGVQVFQLEAPIDANTLMELATTMDDGDILFLDEIHQQAVGDRRTRSSSTQPEVLFSILEDFTMPTASGVMQFPHITIIGATTDPGLLPTPFLNRFPIKPRLEKYSQEDMEVIVRRNAEALGLGLTISACTILANASRSVPREANNLVRNCAMLTDFKVNDELAFEVIRDLNGLTDDGLTYEMQETLRYLYTKCARYSNVDGAVRYQASVSNIATAVGLARDQRAVQLHVEPELIQRGYLQVGHGGRLLTDLGQLRAMSLVREA